MHNHSTLLKQIEKIIEPKLESKEQFFNTKRPTKRMRTSQCLSEPIQTSHNNPFSQMVPFTHSKDDLLEYQLLSTFGSDQVLSFNIKQPRRKRNKNQQLDKIDLKPYQFDSVRETPIASHFQVYNSRPKQERIQKIVNFTIQDFILLEKLGEGTYSQVFKAIQKRSGIICALKILSKKLVRELNFEQNLIRQIKISSFFQHPNIIKIYGYFQDQQFIYLITEYASYGNLLSVIPQPKIKLKRGLMTETVSKIAGQLTSAVKHMHSHSVIHRDIKPQNVLLTLGVTVKICDFGWAIYNPNRQMRSTFCGTPLYLAPQQIFSNEYDESVDVWAIGVLTYELLTEQTPFRIKEIKDLKNIKQEEINYQSIRNKAAVDFLRRSLEKDPSRRVGIFELSSHPFVWQDLQQFCIQY